MSSTSPSPRWPRSSAHRGACRQLAVRARRRVREERPRFHPARAEIEDLSTRFFAAARQGDVDGLVALLAEDAEFVGDGGDSRRGVARVLTGRAEVARMASAAVRRVVELDAELEPTWVGSQPAVLIVDPEGALVGVWSLDVDRAEVRAVHGVVNPAKLGHLGLELTDWASIEPADRAVVRTAAPVGRCPARPPGSARSWPRCRRSARAACAGCPGRRRRRAS